jgi:hypothetical protein
LRTLPKAEIDNLTKSTFSFLQLPDVHDEPTVTSQTSHYCYLDFKACQEKELDRINFCNTNQTQAGKASKAQTVSQGSAKQKEMSAHQNASRVFLRQ